MPLPQGSNTHDHLQRAPETQPTTRTANQAHGLQASHLHEISRIIRDTPSNALLLDEAPAGTELRAAIRAVARHARETDPVCGERVILALRSSWREMPELQALRNEGLREALWERVLRTCLEEFYDYKIER